MHILFCSPKKQIIYTNNGQIVTFTFWKKKFPVHFLRVFSSTKISTIHFTAVIDCIKHLADSNVLSTSNVFKQDQYISIILSALRLYFRKKKNTDGAFLTY